MSPRPFRRLLLLVVAAGLCFFAGAHARVPDDPMRALGRVLGQRHIDLAGRLSVLPHASAAVRTQVTPAETRRVQRLLASRAEGTAAWLHINALTDLAYSDSANVGAADHALANLHQARSLGEPNAAVLADLSAAYLERARRAQSLADLPRAVQAAREALALDDRHPTARYNLAAALDALTLDDQARAAWQAVAALKGDAPTVAHARARADALRIQPRPRPAARAPRSAWTAYAAREPQFARLHAMETLLPEWGAAVAAGRSADAARLLSAAEAVGQALLRRPGGDPSLADQVRAIRAVEGQPGHLRALAQAHAHYGVAQRMIDQRVPSVALARLDSASAASAASPPLRAWLVYWRGVALFFDRKPDPGLFRQVLAEANARGYPALAARAHWSLSTIVVRQGGFDSARVHLDTAKQLYSNLGEREHLGTVQALDAEMRFDRGDDAGGYAAARVALQTLRPYRDAVRLHNLLMALGRTASLEGLGEAAAALHEEDLAVAARVRPATHGEALVARARALTKAGNTAAARADLLAGARRLEEAVASMWATAPGADSTYEQKWLAVDLREGLARLRMRSDPRAAADSLRAVVAFFEGSNGAVSRLLPALVLRAEARLAAGDQDSAVADLDRSSRLLDSLSSWQADAAVRAAMLNAGRRVFDQLALLRAPDARASLEALERGRVSFSPRRRARGEPLRRLSAPAGAVVLDYALVGDTLLTFTISDTVVRLERRRVNAAGLLAAAERVRASMEQRAVAGPLRGDLSLLYDVLVRPVANRLPPGASLVVVADGELAAVPFEALTDTARGRYLVQDREIRYASSLVDAHAVVAATGPGGPPLFVADPAFRRADNRGLQRLHGLAGETRGLAATHRGALVLADTQATPGRVRARLDSAGFFYFAGHAVFDDARPERSYLLLAPDSARSSSRLSAEEVAGMNLRGLRLVVLAACETQRSVGGRAGGFAGLSSAFLDAGAAGVIGSLWPVDDAYTRVLMAEFNRAYLTSPNPAAALRQAQLRLLASGDPALSSPSAWAGFRYAGAASR